MFVGCYACCCCKAGFTGGLEVFDEQSVCSGVEEEGEVVVVVAH